MVVIRSCGYHPMPTEQYMSHTDRLHATGKLLQCSVQCMHTIYDHVHLEQS